MRALPHTRTGTHVSFTKHVPFPPPPKRPLKNEEEPRDFGITASSPSSSSAPLPAPFSGLVAVPLPSVTPAPAQQAQHGTARRRERTKHACLFREIHLDPALRGGPRAPVPAARAATAARPQPPCLLPYPAYAPARSAGRPTAHRRATARTCLCQRAPRHHNQRGAAAALQG